MEREPSFVRSGSSGLQQSRMLASREDFRREKAQEAQNKTVTFLRLLRLFAAIPLRLRVRRAAQFPVLPRFVS